MSRSTGELGLIFEALVFAADKHRDQRRKNADASPYINHPIALANVLVNEGQVADPTVICAALLHDTIEDTETTVEEIQARFGPEVCGIVQEVSDDRTLSSSDRKRLQIEHAPGLSRGAKLVKLADKICNLRDVADNPPVGWSLTRKQEYFDWAKRVVDGMRGASGDLEQAFDRAYAERPR